MAFNPPARGESARGGDGFGRIVRTRLATRRRNGQIRLVFPSSSPGLTGPALQRNGADGGAILVSDHLAPGTGIRGANLRRTLTHAKQALTTRSQTRNGPPVLSTC